MSYVRFVGMTAITLLALGGCCFGGDETCDQGTFVARCEGNVAVYCGGSGRMSFASVRRETCPGACVASGAEATCVVAPPTECGADYVGTCSDDGTGVLTCLGVGDRSYVGIDPCLDGARCIDGACSGP